MNARCWVYVIAVLIVAIEGASTPTPTPVVDGCQQCATTRNCATAYRNTPGQYCGKWLTNLGVAMGCCCPANAACAMTTYACSCKATATVSSTNGATVGAAIGGAVFTFVVICVVCFIKKYGPAACFCCRVTRRVAVAIQLPVAVPVAQPITQIPVPGAYPGKAPMGANFRCNIKGSLLCNPQGRFPKPAFNKLAKLYISSHFKVPTSNHFKQPSQVVYQPPPQVVYQQPLQVAYQQPMYGGGVVIASQPMGYGDDGGFIQGMILGEMLDGGMHHHHHGGFDGGHFDGGHFDGGHFGGDSNIGNYDGGGGTFAGDF
ncbi:hypothetical protein ACHHYP_20167 [Achlya hypogyna]|uniref:Secreted protein n=1 Tax=Achlya hypogyna TaxID=1202772 RepID=A0A1V9Z1N4_ACHHY|nr:hypothetical protein ACHHYP_20167 [Achlya hypogyna]